MRVRCATRNHVPPIAYGRRRNTTPDHGRLAYRPTIRRICLPGRLIYRQRRFFHVASHCYANLFPFSHAASYLLFDGRYAQALIEEGYRDAAQYREALRELVDGGARNEGGAHGTDG